MNFLNLENNAQVSIADNIDVHHIFPSKYIEDKFGNDSDEYDFSDSILNKIRINRKSNIKISNKCPGTYLKDFKDKSSETTLIKSLESHFIPNSKDLINGKLDTDFMKFLNLRYKEIEPLLQKLKTASEKLNSGDNQISI